jgi:hypothetical protein
MINRIFVFSLLLLSFYVHAQKDSNRFREPFLSINAGGGIPPNSYGNPSLFGHYATNGYILNILGGIPIAHSHIGVIGSISYNAEPFDVNQRFLDLYPNDTYTVNQLVSSSYSDFKEALLMGGIFFSIGEKSAFDFRFMAGGNFCTLAGYSLTGTSTITTVFGDGPKIISSTHTNEVSSSLQPVSSSSIVYDFDIDCRFLQRKHIIGLLSCDFMYSQAYFNTIYDDKYYEHIPVAYYLLSFTAGIGYKF